jgi:alginate biosynthesis protein AlgX
MRPFLISAALVLASALSATAATAAPSFNCPRVDAGEIEGTYLTTPVHQGEEGWFFREGSDLEDFFDYGDDTLAYLKRFSKVLEARGTRLVYLPVPPKAVIEPQKLGSAGGGFIANQARQSFSETVAALNREGIATVNLLDAPPGRAGEDFFFARDFHWRPEGARAAAFAVKAALTGDPVYEALDKSGYATTDQKRAEPFRSAMLRALQRLCTDELPQEKAELYETLADGGGGVDLFGGDGTTPVALVGTSFSDIETFNFVGFLQEALGLEVANYAISGGGAFTALESLTHSDVFETAPPKLLVWENPAYDRLDGVGVSQFRQIIPAIRGYCDGAAKLVETSLHIESGGAATLPLSDKNVSGSRFYLALKATETSIRNIQFDIRYADGDGEIFAVSRSDRAKASDRFFIEFSDDIPSTVSEVAISGQPDRPTDFTVQLCKAPEEN